MNNKIHKLNALFIALLFVFGVMSSTRALAGKRSDTPFMTNSFNLSSGELYVTTSGGYIRVEGNNRNDVIVEVFVSSGKYSDEKIRKIIEEDYEIRIEKIGSRIEATARKSGSVRWNNISISFVVYTPRDFDCELRTSGGSLKLYGVAGKKHELVTSGGSISIENSTGDLTAKTSGGSINISGFEGEVDAKTSGGGIRLEDVIGDIRAATSGGGIKIKDVEGSLSAITSGGSINANITKLTDRLTLKTSGGSIRATIPEDLGLDLDLRGNRVVTTLSNFTGETKTSRVTGTVNGGGIPVELATSGGSIYLDYQ